MPFNFDYGYTPKKGTMIIVRYRESGYWKHKVFNKYNCGSLSAAQQKAMAFVQFLKASPFVDLIIRPQILQN